MGCWVSHPQSPGMGLVPVCQLTPSSSSKAVLTSRTPQTRMGREPGQAGDCDGGREASSHQRHLQNQRDVGRNELIPADPLCFIQPESPPREWRAGTNPCTDTCWACTHQDLPGVWPREKPLRHLAAPRACFSMTGQRFTALERF